ncbi:hypothetical protein ABBQ38_012694 [Trebouxia sp. C0009 RCD-2024]
MLCLQEDISLLDPTLQRQWDRAANAHLGNTLIKTHSSQKVWWTCDQCPDGHLHSWSAAVYSRSNGNGCPQCSGGKVCKHNSLATSAPLVAAHWDYAANEGTPDNVAAQSHQAVGWLCDVCGGRWNAPPGHGVSKMQTGCPACCEATKVRKRSRHPTFAECRHPLLAEWDHEWNAAQGMYPDKALYPDIAAEWDHARNKGQPNDHTAGTSYLAWWFSPQRGSWQQTILARTNAVKMRNAIQKHRLRIKKNTP